MSSFLRSLRRDMSRQHIVLRDGNVQVALHRNAKLVAVIEEDSKLPLWLLANAKAAATHNCRRAEAAEWEGFVALTSVCTAAEALANRLLEPLVTAQEWDGLGKKSLERKSIQEKWVKLSAILKTDPPFTLGTEPIQSFKQVVDARNALVHFKHGANMRRFETERRFRVGSPLPSLDDMVKQPPTRVLQEGTVEPTLAPSLAATYYEAFERVLLPILEKCAGTAVAEVADRIRQTLAIADEAIRNCEG
jgi:hypothetical protein